MWCMPDPRGFLEIQRRGSGYRPVAERLADQLHQTIPPSHDEVRAQATRCMGCGVPFCHSGCPLTNTIPDWNDLARRGLWSAAAEELHSTNNFPELTGRLCPAPCEEACVLALNDEPVTIREIELAIADRALGGGWEPQPPAAPSGRSVAIVGSGPAGLAAAQQLTRAGHAVTVFERDPAPGGLLRFGIPDYKLEKSVIDARLDQMRAEGTAFECSVDVGAGVAMDELRQRFDAVVLATGAQRPRDVDLPGRDLLGVEFAMPYLTGRNRVLGGFDAPSGITAAGRKVVILGGGDTSADCLGCALREQAESVIEVAHGPTPPTTRTPLRVWPEWPFVLRSYGAHAEGGRREFQLEPVEFLGTDGRLTAIRLERMEFPGFDGVGRRPRPQPTGEQFVLDVDLVLIAVGFAGAESSPLLTQLGIELGPALTVPVDSEFQTAADGVFAAGDCVRGADLIVTAIADGRRAAAAADAYLAAVPTDVGVLHR